MQHGARWKAAANLELLYGAEHPPARPERESTSVLGDVPGAVVDARNTVSFKNTLYCNRQDAGYASTRQRLVNYYRFMFSKISLWKKDLPHNGGAKGESTEASVVKQEENEEDGESFRLHEGAAPPSYRAVGILTQTNNPGDIGDDLLLPWDFYPITDVNDEDSYVECFKALTKETAHANGLLHMEAEEEDGAAAAGNTNTASNDNGDSRSDGRLSLYTRLVPQFTGIYPGMAIGVVGDPFKRSTSGALTGVLVRQFILPSRPVFPWSVERPLSTSSVSNRIPTRVHFCSGPFPRRDITSILAAVTNSALSRGADLLIIGGPLVKEFEGFEKELLSTMQRTFDELLGTYLDSIEELISNYYAANGNRQGNRQHLKVVLVSHRDDVTQIPALPNTMYGVQDGGDVWVRSNPCRISVNGIHFGICNEDVVGDMRNKMVERWPTQSGSLRRVVETLVQSRLYAPIYGLPAVKHELKHLHTLRIDYLPEKSNDDENDDEEENKANERNGTLTSSLTWDGLASVDSVGKKEFEDIKQETKRVKRETAGNPFPLQNEFNSEAAVEWMPHVMFLPSTRPRFSVVTHRGVWNEAQGTSQDESELDNVSTASGVMVVNQEIWSKRSSPKFELRVAEVTIPDSDLVMRRGASEANGVSCGLIHFVSSTVN